MMQFDIRSAKLVAQATVSPTQDKGSLRIFLQKRALCTWFKRITQIGRTGSKLHGRRIVWYGCSDFQLRQPRPTRVFAGREDEDAERFGRLRAQPVKPSIGATRT